MDEIAEVEPEDNPSFARYGTVAWIEELERTFQEAESAKQALSRPELQGGMTT